MKEYPKFLYLFTSVGKTKVSYVPLKCWSMISSNNSRLNLFGIFLIIIVVLISSHEITLSIIKFISAPVSSVFLAESVKELFANKLILLIDNELLLELSSNFFEEEFSLIFWLIILLLELKLRESLIIIESFFNKESHFENVSFLVDIEVKVSLVFKESSFGINSGLEFSFSTLEVSALSFISFFFNISKNSEKWECSL